VRALSLIAVTGFLVLSVRSQGPSKQLTIQDILKEKDLWGKDFPQALARIEGLQQIGQEKATVFSDEIVGGTQYASPAAANEAAIKFKAATKSAQPEVNKAMQLLWNVPTINRNALAEDINIRPENGRETIASTPRVPAQFLSPNVTIATVQQKLGPAEKVSQETIQTEYERRPVILTKYSYANGAISFAESNMKPKGTIDRVVIDTPQVAGALKELSSRK
jgi:hypothetical protein